MDNLINEKTCQNCGHRCHFAPIFNRNDLLICNNCGSWSWINNYPLDLNNIYNSEYFEGSEYIHYPSSEKSQCINFQRKIDILKSHIDLPEQQWKILEIGSATGVFLDELKKSKHSSIIGVEVSEYARDVARMKGHRVLNPLDESTNEQIKEFSPNIICAWDVWEHLEDPSDIFKDYMTLSEKEDKCYVAITTIDSSSPVARRRKTSWRQFHPPTHIHYPSKNALKYFFQGQNGELLHHSSFGMYRPLGEYLGSVTSKKLLSYLMPRFSLFSYPIKLDLGDIQFVLARINNRSSVRLHNIKPEE